MSFSKMETFLEKHIEGFFNSKFASDLQFVEIQKNVMHIINRNHKKMNDVLFVPNYYEVEMSEPDYERICSRKSKKMLYEYIVRNVIRENLFIAGQLCIKFCRQSSMKKGNCNINSLFRENTPDSVKNDVAECTIVIKKPTIEEAAAMPSEHFYAGLTVVKGQDIDAHLEIGEQQIHIGRREENEFLLTDLNVSRLHAYISFKNYRHILSDANSLNGTFVNGKRIQQLCLKNKDVISMGNSQLLYEVL
ncbi:FhaA domain-containing protein [Pectinatus sottacetonis]|uniref:FhaA domain-containing protein n=1 Tax=Pectinatus sottacetonis TaxID=1002795 RepID=UPI0018C48B5A|nr:FhaA domain-containing protein [Pectinatus sottacetonis]